MSPRTKRRLAIALIAIDGLVVAVALTAACVVAFGGWRGAVVVWGIIFLAVSFTWASDVMARPEQ